MIHSRLHAFTLHHSSLLAFTLPLLAAPLSAQKWVSGLDLPIVKRASDQRIARAADTSIATWRATAHGILRLGEASLPGEAPNPVITRADELVVDVYGKLPDKTKQVIRSWRDTTFVPTFFDRYHRDHLGIVANDFGGSIRLGDGDEVRDLIHPLSVGGLTYYEFLPGDTTTVRRPQGVTRVQMVEVRPKDPHSAGTIGTLAIDIDLEALVRFNFTFTAESYRDPSVRDITVSLESSLLFNKVWLPYRQSIVIRRNRAMNSMIRADWELSDYVLGGHEADSLFRVGMDSLPSIDGQLSPRSSRTGQPPIATAVADLPPPEEGVHDTHSTAAAIADGRKLDGARRGLSFPEEITSTLFTINRVEGITLYPGASFPVGRTMTGTVRVGYGFSDHRLIGLARLEVPMGRLNWTLKHERSMQDVGDVRPVPSALASIYSLITGHDYFDWTLLDRTSLGLRFPLGKFQVTMDGGYERSTSVETKYIPNNQLFENPPLGAGDASVAHLTFGRSWSNRNEFGIQLEAGQGDATWTRAAANLSLYQSIGFGKVVLMLSGGAGSEELPGYRNFVLGGSTTLPGIKFRSIGGRSMASANLGYEMRLQVPSFLRNSRPGQNDPNPTVNTVTPFFAAGVANGDNILAPWRATGEVSATIGLRFNLGGLYDFSIGTQISGPRVTRGNQR